MLLKNYHRLFKNIVAFIFIASASIASAQQYPIQLTTQLAPPFTGYLEDYGDDALQKMRLLVLQTDLTEPNYDIKLKIKIEGSGIKIQSKGFYYAGPYNLQPGMPIMLSGSDLAGLLNINNLDFSGISKSDYQKKKVLPEGFYEICITAYDNNNPAQIQVSNASCAQGWMVHSDPPYLNMPACGDKIKSNDPQNILFQWTAMNLSSPNSAAVTDYEFSLYEIRPAGQNPNNIVQTIPPIYQTTVTVPLINYGITEPPLAKGREYAWRVRAMDESGRDYFKNKGYSSVCTFTYGSIYDDLIPLVLHAQPLSIRSVKFTWDKIANYAQYKVEYRKTGDENYQWFSLSTIDNAITAYDLEEKTEYMARLKGITSDGYESEWSSEVKFITPEKKDIACGDMPVAAPLPGTPLQTAAEYMIWQVGQFEMIVTKLQNNASLIGRYTGEGKIKIPFVGITLAVWFENILVNDARVVVAGEVRAVTKGIDQWEEDIKIKEAEENAIYTEGTVDSAWYNNGQVCYTTKQNQNPRCEPVDSSGLPVVVRDGEGNEVIVNEDGTVKAKNYLKYSPDSLSATTRNQVTFEHNTRQQWGFDTKTYPAFTEQYEVIKLKDTSNYFVPYKGIADGQRDVVTAKISIPGFDNNILSFVTQTGTRLSHTTISAQEVEMEVPHNSEALYAYYNGNKVGKLNITSLKPLTKKIIIVPVGTMSLPGEGLRVGLNEIYKQANVTWDVSIANNFNNTSWDLNHDNKLEGADATLFNKYSEEMRQLKKAYQQYDSTYDKKAYYIFVVSQFSNPDQKGYMVRSKAVGFIAATALSTQNSARLLAHELAHGAFGLEHTFPQAKQGSTNNLLDYVSQTALTNKQWKQIHSALPTLSWLDDEEDGAYSTLVHLALSPNGKLVDDFYLKENGKETKLRVEFIVTNNNYALEKIKYNEEYYIWDGNVFKGSNREIIAKNNPAKPARVNLFKRVGDGCNYLYTIINWDANDEANPDFWKLVNERTSAPEAWISCPYNIRQASCNEQFLEDIKRKNKNCNEEEIKDGDTRLSIAFSASDASVMTDIVNSVCMSSLRKLKYDQLKGLFLKISSLSSIKEQQEIALMRLMNAFDTKDYENFYALLELNSNQLLKHLVDEIDDGSTYPWDGDNYTNFIGALVTMFKYENRVNKFYEAGNEKLLGQVYNLNPQPFKSFKESNEFLSFDRPLNSFRINGVYNPATGNLSVSREQKIGSFVPSIGGGGGVNVESWQEVEKLLESISPLAPLVITTEKELPIVNIALEGNEVATGLYVVPAIFFKYKADKEFNDNAIRGSTIVLDAVTIYTSGGVALATKVNWVRRLWALTEVAGAVGNIAINTNALRPGDKLYNAMNIYNATMALIGIKNAAQGIVNFSKQLPAQTRQLLLNNSNIKAVIAAKFLDWQVAITSAGNLSDAEKQLLIAGKIEEVASLTKNEKEILQQQQKAWELLEVTENTKSVSGIKLFKNVLYDDFIKTFTATEEQYKKAYQFWGEEKWDDLYKYFNDNNLNNGWPPYYGFKSITKSESGSELAEKLFDRFQRKGDISGSFASPVYGSEGVNDLYFTYDSRALASKIEEGTNYIKFKFKNTVPSDVILEYGDVIPWFGKQGLGDQIKSSYSLLDLKRKNIREVLLIDFNKCNRIFF